MSKVPVKYIKDFLLVLYGTFFLLFRGGGGVIGRACNGINMIRTK